MGVFRDSRQGVVTAGEVAGLWGMRTLLLLHPHLIWMRSSLSAAMQAFAADVQSQGVRCGASLTSGRAGTVTGAEEEQDRTGASRARGMRQGYCRLFVWPGE
ncbi:hypothetical protein PVAP13_3NG076915 [Panicum virgatum]|uniref:Uncharacterized protein n=1 Tax=Panicum virgatum TaxID=38727 RepID=A0A8T0UER3_PANVG|nr:hypothetical protein PVAP13_3NG076915 [Panicum virgatum]